MYWAELKQRQTKLHLLNSSFNHHAQHSFVNRHYGVFTLDVNKLVLNENLRGILGGT
jgi:hypothetical protein